MPQTFRQWFADSEKFSILSAIDAYPTMVYVKHVPAVHTERRETTPKRPPATAPQHRQGESFDPLLGQCVLSWEQLSRAIRSDSPRIAFRPLRTPKESFLGIRRDWSDRGESR